MKTILLITDFSEHALFALKAAGGIARKINGKINLVQVYQHPSLGEEFSYHYTKEYYEEAKANADKELDELIKQNSLTDIQIDRNILSKTTLEEVMETDKFKNPDLIVMGANGRSGHFKSFIGASVEKVIRISNAPVLILKNEIEDFTIHKMVFASDFLDESYQAFEKIKFFADRYNSHIYLLKVITPKEFEESPKSHKKLVRFAKMFKLVNYSINVYNDFSIGEGILNFSNEKNVDLIAMETHGRTGFAHFMLGSLAESVVKHESKPILSVKIQKTTERAQSNADRELIDAMWGAE